MPIIIIIILLGVPYLEFLVFLKVGNIIGGGPAILLTLLSAVVGIYLIRAQGLVVLSRMRETLQKGESPMEDVLHGFFLLVAGLFFLLPGFITDSIALLLAIPFIRAGLGRAILKNIGPRFYHQSSYHEGIVIDGEFEKEPENQENIDHKN